MLPLKMYVYLCVCACVQCARWGALGMVSLLSVTPPPLSLIDTASRCPNLIVSYILSNFVIFPIFHKSLPHYFWALLAFYLNIRVVLVIFSKHLALQS